LFPQLKTDKYPNLPNKLTFLHAEDILDMYPDLPRKARETEVLKKYPAIFIYGIGYPHELRALTMTTGLLKQNQKMTDQCTV